VNARFRGVSSSASTTARCGKIQQLGCDPGDHVVMAGSPRAVAVRHRGRDADADAADFVGRMASRYQLPAPR
jgi:hypothetical protein